MDYINDEDRAKCIRKDFENHIATLSAARDHIGEIATLEWRRPQDGFYRIVYMMRGGLLVVYGDCGAATYQWSGKADLKFLAGCDLDYFASKCQASEDGRGGKNWDSEYARHRFFERFAGSGLTGVKISQYLHYNNVTFDKHEWFGFLMNDPPPLEHYHLDPSELSLLGQRESVRTHYHLIGLKMAHAQLNPKPEVTEAAVAEVSPCPEK